MSQSRSMDIYYRLCRGVYGEGEKDEDNFAASVGAQGDVVCPK
ncbi:hypothetical protein [Paenibacillus melissococcoides]|nr:hypothetical protein [Paenibacillus melissococcoides]